MSPPRCRPSLRLVDLTPANGRGSSGTRRGRAAPRARAAADLPGWLDAGAQGRQATAVHILRGAAVVVAGYLPRDRRRSSTCSGPAAELSPFGGTHNRVIEFTPAPGADWARSTRRPPGLAGRRAHLDEARADDGGRDRGSARAQQHRIPDDWRPPACGDDHNCRPRVFKDVSSGARASTARRGVDRPRRAGRRGGGQRTVRPPVAPQPHVGHQNHRW